jgi:hypothetical protein
VNARDNPAVEEGQRLMQRVVMQLHPTHERIPALEHRAHRRRRDRVTRRYRLKDSRMAVEVTLCGLFALIGGSCHQGRQIAHADDLDAIALNANISTVCEGYAE